MSQSEEKAAKPKLFVGSSSEGLQIARAIYANLADVAEITIWTDNVFRSNDGNLEALLKALRYFDFAVFALTPDDTITSRGKTQQGPRDNALFEFGLFLGHLGRERCFAVAPDDHMVKLPSDLHGVTIARYESNRSDANLKAALTVPCALIRDEVQKLHCRTASTPVATLSAPTQDLQAFPPRTDAKEESLLEVLELDKDGSVMVVSSPDSPAAWFHADRITKAFPGVRGLQEIADPRASVERLSILMRQPLTWVWNSKLGPASASPLWWWRGMSNMYVQRFSISSETEVLMDHQELLVRRVVAFNPPAYWRCFVYVEADPMPPTGLYARSSEDVARMVALRGYCDEEYAVFQKRFVTREEYDDGAAIIDGKPTRIPGAELRVRFVTPYNFVIASQQSPINSSEFSDKLNSILNGILGGTNSVATLAQEIQELPRRGDFDGYGYRL